MKKILLSVLALGVIFISSTAFIVYSSGEAGKTGSPTETTCASCHSGGTGTTIVGITGNPTFTSNQYVPGQTYTINVNVQNTSYSFFSLGCEVLNSSNTDAGTMSSCMSGAKFLTATNGRKNVTHTTPKAGTGAAIFSFVWIAPSTGTATIYAAGNAVNNNGTTIGDQVGNSSLVLSPLTTTDVKEAVTTGFTDILVYPNPIISKFKISYSIATDAMVNASLYDIQGKLANELINETQVSGNHTLKLSLPDGLPKGAYIVKLATNSNIAAQRLVIVQ